MEQLGFTYETVSVWNGEGAVETPLVNYKGRRYSPKIINKILNGTLVFGNREQIRALEAWGFMDLKQREKEGLN
jgi:hypothetical protein